MKWINSIELISTGYNCYNGFHFCILDLDLNKPNIDSSLLGIGISKDYIQVHILFLVTIYLFNLIGFKISPKSIRLLLFTLVFGLLQPGHH